MEFDCQTILKMIFELIGGLGIFLYGMKNMSEGMQAVAGSRLRKLINSVTNNRFLATGVGTLVTSIIQSSSVTTVIVVGMVSAGIMTLHQAIGVIFGANIGTTMTAWILAVDLGKYGLPMLGIAVFFVLFAKQDKLRYTAIVFMGLGMVFFGLVLMKDSLAPLQKSEEVLKWFSRFEPNNYLGVLKCIMVGAIVTGIIQSSSATVGITMGLAFNGIISYPTAAALVLGENIGTTVTALLASIGTSTNAKRAALAHTMFNVTGVIWISTIFPFYIKFIEWFVRFTIHKEPLATMSDSAGNLIYPNVGYAIAATHSCFNIANVIVFLPLVGILAKILMTIIPSKKEEKPHLTYLDIGIMDTPALAIQQSQKEVMVMADDAENSLGMLRNVLAQQKPDKKTEEKIFEAERILDLIQKEIVEFLTKVMGGNVSHAVINEGRKQLRMADEYESISDYTTSILKLNLKLREAKMELSKDALAEILGLHDKVAEYIKQLNLFLKEEATDIMAWAESDGKNITHLMKDYRSNHLDRLETGNTSPIKTLIFIDMLNAYRKIKDHAFNIAETLAGEK